MFARTPRLLLRPGWAEDAPELARAMADVTVVCTLSGAPRPYGLADAEASLAAPRDPVLPSFLITARTASGPAIVGSCRLGRRESGRIALRYWIAQPWWNRGFATEAGRALIEIAATLGFDRLDASYFLDNPASARVLEKLGFVSTGLTAPQHSCTRGGDAPARLLQLDIASYAPQALAA